MKGYQAFPELLERAGACVVFGMLGASNVPWLAEGVSSGTLSLVKTRHEETAVNAAVGYARSTGRIGICTVTRGPGFANSVNALTAAAQNHFPIILIVAESPATLVRTTQTIDQQALTAVTGAGFHHVCRADHLEDAFWDALSSAGWNGRPQVLSIADGILEAELELAEARPEPRQRTEELDHRSVAACVDALSEAERPLILAGQGAVLAGCRSALGELATLSGAGVASTLMANRYFSGHPGDLGICGTWSAPLSRDTIRQTDLVLAVGASLNRYTTADREAFGAAKVIHCEVDVDQPCLASDPSFALIGDAQRVVGALLEEWKARDLPPRELQRRIPSYDDNRGAIMETEIGFDPARGLDPRQVYRTFDSLLPPDRIVVTDAGRHARGALASLVDAQDAHSWLIGNSFGSIGRGLGNAIGAAAAHPDRTVVLFCGDGGFMMSAQDLDAVRLNGLDLTVVIMNDEQYGSEVGPLAQFGLPLDIIRQDLPDIPMLARAFGGTGHVLRDPADLARASVPGSGLVVFEVRIDPQADAGAALG